MNDHTPLIEAYYLVSSDLRRNAEQMLDTSERLARIADRLSEETMLVKSPDDVAAAGWKCKCGGESMNYAGNCKHCGAPLFPEQGTRPCSGQET